MRITLSSAMRARDVSRPTDEQLAAAAEWDARMTRVGRPRGASSGVGPGSAVPVVAPVEATAPVQAVEIAAPVAVPPNEEEAPDEAASPTRRRRRRRRGR